MFRLLCLFFACLSGLEAFLHIDDSCDGRLFVGSFNIKNFGRTKMNNPDAADYITKIVSRYDMCLILQTRDKSGEALQKLWKNLNETEVSDEGWGLIQSDPLGRTDFYKEQYVFFYRLDRAHIEGTYQDPDPTNVFEREPFSAEFQYCADGSRTPKRITFQAFHAQPKNTVAELKALPDTIEAAKKQFQDSMGVISMGAYNADCTYASDSDRKDLKLFQGGDFKSLIADDADTTVSADTDCAYDRVVLYGNDINAKNGKVFDFVKEYNLEIGEATAISSNFPVEFDLF